MKSELVKSGANVTLQDQDDSNGCIRDKIGISKVLQRTLSDGSFGLTQMRGVGAVDIHANDHLYWFSQDLLIFYAKSECFAADRKELENVQYFEVALLMNKI